MRTQISSKEAAAIMAARTIDIATTDSITLERLASTGNQDARIRLEEIAAHDEAELRARTQ